MSIPPLFRCPISLELFTDPVTLCTGQTYDRPSIEKWIASGNLTCPVTMQRLHDLSMVPNHTLSHLIHLWLNQTAHSTPIDTYLVALKQTLESQQPIWEKKLQALKHLSTLPSVDDQSLLRFGFFQILINLAFEEEEELASLTHQRLELVELALAYVVKLMPFSDLGRFNLLKKESRFAALSILLEKGTHLIKILICNILEAVLTSSSNETEELSAMIRASADIQRSIINLTYNEDENISEEAVKVVLAFSTNSEGTGEQTLENLVQAGAIRGLTRHILSVNGGSTAAAAALEALVAVEGGKEALLREEKGVKALVKMVFRVSDHQGSESALNGLMGLCGASAAAREEVVKAGVLTQLLLLIQSQCGWQIKVKARALLRMLGNVWSDQESMNEN